MRKHADARQPLEQWSRATQQATWRSIDDVRDTFPAADGVPVRVRGGGTVVATVFNIKGNTYRLITIISYQRGIVQVREVLTHAEYDKDAWKDRL